MLSILTHTHTHIKEGGLGEDRMKNLVRVKLKILNQSQEGGPNPAVHGEPLQACVCVCLCFCVSVCALIKSNTDVKLWVNICIYSELK